MSFRHHLRHIHLLIGCKTAGIEASNVFKSSVVLAVVAILGVASPSVFAQSDEAASIKIGESDFVPIARFEYLQFSNVFATNTDETEATAFVIKPRANWIADRRLLTLTGIYEGEYASFSEKVLNYADHSLRAIVDAELSTRNRVRARLAFNYGHQPPGTGAKRDATDRQSEQVEFIQSELVSSYTYGAKNARGNVELGMRLGARSYQNEETFTEDIGYTQISPYGQFSLRLSSDTRAISTVRFGSFSFDNNILDRNDLSLLAGLRFAATGKSGGEFQLGTTFSEWTHAQRDDENSFVVEAELFYEPSTFSRFELSAARVLDNYANSPLTSGSVLSVANSAKLNWTHEWSSRLYHVARLSYRFEEGDCPADAAESFDIADASGSFEMNLVVRRWLHVGASFRGASSEFNRCQDIDGNNANREYQTQTIGFQVRATL